MLRSYFEIGEIIYLYKKFNGKRFSRRYIYLAIIAILFLILSVFCFLLGLKYEPDIFFFSLLSFAIFIFLFSYFFRINKQSFKENKLINIEYAITNKRFIVYDYSVKKVYCVPITTFYDVYVNVKDNYVYSPKGSLVLRLESRHAELIPLNISNNDIEITPDGVVFFNIDNVYLLKNQINFLRLIHVKKINDIYNVNNFLHRGEVIVHSQEFKKEPSSQIRSNIGWKILLILIPIIYILFLVLDAINVLPLLFASSDLIWVFFLVYLIVLVTKGPGIYTVYKHRNDRIHLHYVFTNKRVLFIDYANLVLYAFNFMFLDFINISNYDNKRDVGDIFLSNARHSSIVRSYSGHTFTSTHYDNYKDDTHDRLFPPNYLEHAICFNFDNMDCSKIRLYGVEHPQQVIDKCLSISSKNK